jgi:hypothetical protein
MISLIFGRRASGGDHWLFKVANPFTKYTLYAAPRIVKHYIKRVFIKIRAAAHMRIKARGKR